MSMTGRAAAVGSSGIVWSSRRILLCMAIAFSAVYFAMSWRFAGPGYLADEVGYLLNAAALTGDRIDGASSYHFGYSLLIAPAFFIADDPSVIWRIVQALNAAMFGASLVALHAIAERLTPDASPFAKLAAVAVCGLSPMALVMAGYAFATPAFVLVYAVSVLTMLDGRRWAILAHGALVGFLFWVHPSAAGIAVASMAGLTLLAFRTMAWTAPIGAAIIEVASILLYRVALSPALVDRMTPDGFKPQLHYESFNLSKATLYVLWEALVRGLGQLSYVAIGTLGFAVVGLGVAAHLAARATRPADQAGGVYMALSLLGVVGIGSLMFATIGVATRPDHWIYGRYADGVVLPLLLLGLLSKGYRLWALACIAIPAAFLWLAPIPENATDWWWGLNPVNVVSFWPAALQPWGTLAAAMAIGSAVAAMAVLLPRWAAAPVLVVAFVASAYMQMGWHAHVLARMSKPSSLPDVARQSWPSGTCVGLDPDLPEDEYWRVNLYKFHLHDYDIRRMTPDDWRNGCDGPFISSDFADVTAGTKIAAREMNSEILLLAPADRQIVHPASAEGVYPEGSVCLTAVTCFVRDAEEIARRQHTQAGRLDGDKISTTGRPGYLVFGPGLPFKAGRYRITLDADIATAGQSYIDVIDGLSEVARFDLARPPTTFDFDLSNPATALQVRIFVDGNAAIGLRGYTISSQATE